MKLSLSLALVGAIAFLSACEDEPPVRSNKRHPSRYSTQPAVTAPPKQTKGDIPYGIPVPNKPGFVTSPYAPNQGYVDVRGFPPGTEVKDPPFRLYSPPATLIGTLAVTP